MASWLDIDPESSFSLQNIPFGIISRQGGESSRKVPAIAIGDHALDLSLFAENNGFSGLPSFAEHKQVFTLPTLNDFAALGRPVHRQVRQYLQKVLSAGGPFADVLEKNQSLREKCLVPLSKVQSHLPMAIGDYTDFYAGLNHAYNVGVLFRGPDNALQPNYKHLPVGYHGRASSVVPSGTPVRRPNGQILLDMATKKPEFSACRKLDIELELGAFVCRGNAMGEPIAIASAEEHLFGLVLMNDWSARDIQAWEYVPLGPFNSKNFATTISPWVVLMDALEPFRARGLEPGDRADLMPYLREAVAENVYNIRLDVDLKTAAGDTHNISRTDGTNLLFSFNQMLAHHSVTGCCMNTGDLLGSGTISGTTPESVGSLLEKTQNGKVPVQLGAGGETRLFLEDGDEVIMRGVCGETGGLVGFGECRGVILPARAT